MVILLRERNTGHKRVLKNRAVFSYFENGEQRIKFEFSVGCNEKLFSMYFS